MPLDFTPLAGLKRADFYFVRHGESEGNTRAVVQGRLDCALSERGRRQAEATAAWFQGRKIDLVAATPLARGLETAGIIARLAGLAEPEVHQELLELDTGVFTGLALSEAAERYPAMYADFLRRSWDAVLGAENSSIMQRRAEAAWARLIGLMAAPGWDGRSEVGALAVAHAGLLQWIIKVSCGGCSWFPLFPMANCAIFHFSVQGTLTRWESLGLQVLGLP